jgi:uncharacterized protein (DUF433 family)
MDWRAHIHSDPAVLAGKPVIRGTRISVELLLQRLADGWTEKAIFESYPHLPAQSVRAAISFAHDVISEKPEAARAVAA